MNQKRTEISSIGEFGLIHLLTEDIQLQNAETILGVGDDGAVLDSFGKQVVISTDMLVEGVHFDLSYFPLKHLGYKSVIVNLSDIYAMNAEPLQFLLSIAVSNRFPVEALSEFYEGVYLACGKYGVDLIGGDTTSSTSGLIISGTAIGTAAADTFISRDRAKEGDLICVSGDLGAAYLGLQLLERERKIFLENPEIQPDLGKETYPLQRFLKPEARRDIIDFLRKQKVVPSSMMDISDGISSDIRHICERSGVGCVLYEDKLPVAEATKRVALGFNLDYSVCALQGGEDYELLFTISPQDYEKITISEQISVVGEIKNAIEGFKLISVGGNEHELKSLGWDSFKKERGDAV